MKSYNPYTFLAFFFGLISTLFVPKPFGIVSMLDFSCYFLAIPMGIASYGNFPKSLHRLILFSILWVLNGVLSDLWRGTSFNVSLKALMILVDSVCMLVIGGRLMAKSPLAIVRFLPRGCE